MIIYCCECKSDVEARLSNGKEIYPHRSDLALLPFWICDVCGNFVGCHHKTSKPTTPLGCIPTPELKKARNHIHTLLDPIWQQGLINRSKLYKMIGERVGWRYHTAKIRSIDEARNCYRHIRQIKQELEHKQTI